MPHFPIKFVCKQSPVCRYIISVTKGWVGATRLFLDQVSLLDNFLFSYIHWDIEWLSQIDTNISQKHRFGFNVIKCEWWLSG